MPDFEPVYSAAEMRAVEEAHPGYPDTMSELMERAGRAVADEVQRRYPRARSVTVVCGGGSNGGDGKVCALVLGDAGLDVRVVEAPGEEDRGEVDLGSPDVVVDALFGTGFSGTPRPSAGRLIEAMNEADAPVVAVDVPSGVDASGGAVASEAVRAAVTVTFVGRKVGQLVAPGRFHCGELVVADIGLEPGETAIRRMLPAALEEVPHRAADANKYSAGAVVVVGASPGMTGAGFLVPEALETVVEAAKRARAVVLGPGIGRSDGVKALVRELLQTLDIPVVVDADALAGLAPEPFRPPVVLTPHAGELASLLGTDSFRVEAQRLEAVRACAERFGCVTLLKGADTLVADAHGHVVIADHGTAALATAGTGDVLSGVVGAFLAKGLEPARAAALAATAHGLASRRVPHQPGLVASDLLAQLPGVLADPS
jgi:NAD(P)H-hydrate epimerase